MRFLLALLLLHAPSQSPAATEIAGDIVFDDGITEGRKASVSVVMPGTPAASSRPVVDMAATTFIIRQIAGPILVRGSVTGPRGEWGLKMVLLNGKDVTDEPKRLATKDGRLQVVFTARAPAIVGTVTDERERPIDNALVVLFGEDDAAWTPMSSRLQVAQAAAFGAFTMKGVREGRYRLAAVPRDVRFSLAAPDVALLRRLKARATPVVLNAGETRVVDVQLQQVAR